MQKIAIKCWLNKELLRWSVQAMMTNFESHSKILRLRNGQAGVKDQSKCKLHFMPLSFLQVDWSINYHTLITYFKSKSENIQN